MGVESNVAVAWETSRQGNVAAKTMASSKSGRQKLRYHAQNMSVNAIDFQSFSEEKNETTRVQSSSGSVVILLFKFSIRRLSYHSVEVRTKHTR
jgi:hypothetical protein